MSDDRYYQLTWSEGNGQVIEGDFDLDITYPLMDVGSVSFWEAAVFRTSSDASALTDYQASTPAVRLCSSRMRNIIDEFVGDHDDFIQWLDAVVVASGPVMCEYSVLHIHDSQVDVLDLERSSIVKHATHDSVIRPVLSQRKVEGRHILRTMNSPFNLVVSAGLRERLQRAGCTGMEFGRVPMV